MAKDYKIESIYDEIENYLKELINNMQSHKDTIQSRSNNEIKEEHIELTKGLEEIVKSVSDDRKHLRENSEWKVYTIAFYGETNAGKSTLIEALRIFFKEVTKQESWGKFDSAKNIYEASKVALESLENEKKTIEESIPLKEADIQKIQTLIRQQNIVKKLLAFFGFGELLKQQKKLESEHSSLVIKAINIKSELEFAQKKLDENIITLNQYSDGGIIGDGRSDFTQSNVVYEFSHNNKRFNIIDVPGIEGKESKVIEEISKATKKAHCVFYVTPNPTPPQKGDNNNQGTLEKIKEHLGSQTEVYTIYNKKIKNPMQLKSNLVNEGENKSLEGLDTEVKNILGEHYKGRSNISARPTFLALAEYISPFSDVQKEKDKFLSKLSKEEILNNTNFNDFISFLDRDLILSEEELLLKIKQSNYNKLEKNLDSMRLLLIRVKDKVFIKLRDDMQAEIKKASVDIDEIIESHKSNFSSTAEELVRDFKNETSRNVYNHIDRFIDNKEFKAIFEDTLEYEKSMLEKRIETTLQNKMQEIEEDIQEEIKNLQRRISNNITYIMNDLSLNFNTNVSSNIKSGIDKMGLVGSLIGGGGLVWFFAATNIWNPLGIAAAIIGAITLIVSFGKSIIGFFSKTKRAQYQREEVNKKLHSIGNEIENSLEAEKDRIFEAIKEEGEKIKNALEDKIKGLEKFIKRLDDFIDKVESKQRHIKKQGELS